MKISAVVFGLDQVKNRANREVYNIGVGTERGLKKAALILQRASMLLVPVDLGILRGSAYARKVAGSGATTVVAVGYTASYAGEVHENMDLAHGQLYNIKYAYRIGGKQRYYRAPESPQGGTRSWGGGSVPYTSRGPKQQAKFLQNALAWNFRLLVSTVNQSIQEQLGK